MERQQTSKAPQAEQHRAQSSPQRSASIHPSHSSILQLQSQLGNRAVTSLLRSPGIQAKLRIGQPGHQYTQETDQVAGQVMSQMHTPRRESEALGASVQRQEMQDEDEEVQMKAESATIQRQETEEEEGLQMKADPAVLQRQEREEEEPLQGKFEYVQRQGPEEEETLQSKFIPNEPPAQLQGDVGKSASSNGMPGPLRSGLEALSGMNLSGIHVHSNSSKPAQLNALAYTQGQDIHVGPGQEKHLPHEGWHVVQQMQGRVTPTMQAKGVSINDDEALERESDVMGAKALQSNGVEQSTTASTHQWVASLQRQVETKGESGIPDADGEAATRGQDNELGLQSTKVEAYGIAYKKEGVNLRDQPASNPDSKILTRLPFNTRMYVDSVANDHYFVGTDKGQFGYVATTHVKTNLPEPDAKIYYIETGDTALGISQRHYGGKAEWGRDHRFFVNGLVYVNRGTGKRGIYKTDPKADWDTTEVRADYMIWMPSLKFMRSLQGVVKSESITYEAWQTVKNAAIAVGEFLLGTGAFVVGLLHGALESVWDILVGLKDLIVMAGDLLKWLIGLITGDSKGLFDSLKGINWSELVQGWIDDFDAKWNHDSLLKKWHFRGWVIGYAIAEVTMLFFSGGIIQGIKWVGKSAKVAKVISKLPKIAKLGEAAKTSKLGQKFSMTLKAAQGGAMSAKAASRFVFGLLQKPVSIWGKGPDEIADAFRKAGYKVTVSQSERGSKLSKQLRISSPPKGAPKIDRIQIHPGGGRHGGSYYKISSSESSFGTKWIADKKSFQVLPGMDTNKIVWVESGLKDWLLRAAVANAAVQRGLRED